MKQILLAILLLSTIAGYAQVVKVRCHKKKIFIGKKEIQSNPSSALLVFDDKKHSISIYEKGKTTPMTFDIIDTYLNEVEYKGTVLECTMVRSHVIDDNGVERRIQYVFFNDNSGDGSLDIYYDDRTDVKMVEYMF